MMNVETRHILHWAVPWIPYAAVLTLPYGFTGYMRLVFANEVALGQCFVAVTLATVCAAIFAIIECLANGSKAQQLIALLSVPFAAPLLLLGATFLYTFGLWI
jgi:hypothetical protein